MTNPDFEITESLPRTGELYHQRRILDDGQLVFLVNSDTAQSVSATLTVNAKNLIQMDLANGNCTQVPVRAENGVITFDAYLPPAGSALYFLANTNASAIASAEVSAPAPTGETAAAVELPVTENSETTVKPLAENVLVMDYLDLKSKVLDLKDTYFMKAMKQLYDTSGFKMGNPWQHKIQYKQDYLALDTFKTGSGFEVTYRFQVDSKADLAGLGNPDIVIERPEIWDLYLNGVKLTRSDRWWIDREFYRFPVGNNLKPGVNSIQLKAEKCLSMPR